MKISDLNETHAGVILPSYNATSEPTAVKAQYIELYKRQFISRWGEANIYVTNFGIVTDSEAYNTALNAHTAYVQTQEYKAKEIEGESMSEFLQGLKNTD